MQAAHRVPRRAAERAGSLDWRARLIFDDDRRSNRHTVVEIGHVVIGHAEAARRYRLADRLRLVGSVDAIKRRSEIHGAGAERVVDAARHVPRQIGPPRQHLRGRRPARPFLLGGYAVDTAPAKAVAADANAVPQRLAIGQHEVKPPLGGIYQDGAWRVLAFKSDG